MSRTELETELRILKKSKFAEGVVQVLLSLVRWGAIIAISRYAYLAIDSLAGKSTLADIGVNFLGSIKISIALAWSFGIGGTVYGISQTKLHRNTIKRLQSRVQDLETHINSGRSTNSRTINEETKSEDKI